MSWNDLGAQFGLELAFGVLFALWFVPQAPVGHLFYRLMAACAAVALLLAGWLVLRSGGGGWRRPEAVGALLALVLLPTYSRMPAGRSFRAGVALALAGCAVGVAAIQRRALGFSEPGEVLLGTLTALSTGAVAGTVGLAMVLGHWYLTVPKLSIEHLARLNRVSLVVMGVAAAAVAASALLLSGRARESGHDLLDPWGLFHLGTRLAVGLLLPALFGWMAASSLRYRNTRSATGILYASTVLVLIGTAASLWLQDSYRVPL